MKNLGKKNFNFVFLFVALLVVVMTSVGCAKQKHGKPQDSLTSESIETSVIGSADQSSIESAEQSESEAAEQSENEAQDISESSYSNSIAQPTDSLSDSDPQSSDGGQASSSKKSGLHDGGGYSVKP